MLTLKNKWSCRIEILQKEGKTQKKKLIEEVICPRKKLEDYAITKDCTIDINKCIKCYLCLAFCKFLSLDKQRYPLILEKERKDIEIKFNNEDFEKMDQGLSDDEVKCLSKWIYGVFKSIGFEVYKEVGIPNSTLPKALVSVYNISNRKNKRADIELISDTKFFLFENKVYSQDKKWLIEALNQLNLYNQTSLYKKKDYKLVFCFNTRIKEDIISDIKKVLKNPKLLKYQNTIKELIVINTFDLYQCFIKNIDRKNKGDFIKLMNSNILKI